jgi:hypothetical protein
MISPSSHLPELLDWDGLSLKGIELSSDQIQWAVDLSQTVFGISQQWQTYLHALGLLGFEEWLAQRAPDLRVQDSNCSLLQPHYANLLDGVCNLIVGSFRVCLIVTGDRADQVIEVPKAAIELPVFIADLYIWMVVLEEQMQVEIAGYRRREQLVAHPCLSSSSPSDWNYTAPLEWFDPDSTRLLFDLRYRNPADMATAVTPISLLSVAQLQARLTTHHAQLQDPTCVLNQVLTWEEVATLLSEPDLARRIYEIQNPKSKIVRLRHSASAQSSRAHAEVQNSPPVPINVGLWFRDRLDSIAQELAWVLMPVFTPVPALRSIGADLQDLGIQIPANARGAYRNMQLADILLRLYAITWLLPTDAEIPEWSLLVVLKPQADECLPISMREQIDVRLPLQTQLQIYDDQQLLEQIKLEDVNSGAYLYAQVAGTVDESFRVAIALPDYPVETLPPFIFCPGE